ncbi:MAG TPA: response regulator, partial [Nocardioides sp.]
AIHTASTERFTTPGLRDAEQVVAFSVTDTGIGIPPEQLKVIFEAFQQADGTISRKFGGTGLGLSISREIARLIGGEIHVDSEPGRGSTFTLFVPTRFPADGPDSREAGSSPVAHAVGATVTAPQADDVADDRGTIGRDDSVLLVALSDRSLREEAVDLGRARRFKVVTAIRPDEAVRAARSLQPAALLVGMELVTDSGTSLLRALKTDPETRHLPTIAVHSPHAADDVLVGRHAGAIGIVEHPVTTERLDAALEDLTGYLARRTRSLLVVSGAGADEPSVVVALFGAVPEVDLHVATSVAEAADALDARGYDCVVVELKLPGGTAFDVIKRMRSRKALREIPVVVSTGGPVTAKDENRLRQYARSMVVRYPATDSELVEDVALFLHRSSVELPDRPTEEGRRGDRSSFAGRRILIVDDDVRNVFALASALEQLGIDVVYAEHGEAGIQQLEQDPAIDLVLMDVMMPGMDGYTAMREIRRMPTYADLPVIALTAKAMPGDRENSLAAGASDYVTKPVDLDHLLSRLRAWLT